MPDQRLVAHTFMAHAASLLLPVFIARRYLRGFLHSFPASSVLRASPPSQSARPVSRELPVDPHRDHRWDFPCCVWSPSPACRRQYPGRFDGILFARTIPPTSAFPRTGTGRLLHYAFRGLLSVHSRYGLHARQVAFATLCTRGFSSLVASTAALIATRWSEPVPGRVYPRCGPSPFHGAPGNGVYQVFATVERCTPQSQRSLNVIHGYFTCIELLLKV